MRIIFLSTSDIALMTFYSLIKFHDVVAVITNTDKPVGRSKKIAQSPIAMASKNEKIKLYKTDNIDSKLVENLLKLNADIFITFSYGVILKKDFFSIARLGGINIHPSLLPALRGPSPIQTAILQGMTKSGITIQKICVKIDSGDMLHREGFDILPRDDAVSIERKVSSIAAEVIIPLLAKIEKKEITPIPQDDSDASYCKLFKKEDGIIDWNEKGENIVNKIRAFVKWPVSYSFIDNNRINIYRARINKNLSVKDFQNFDNGQIVFADRINGIVVKTNDFLVNIELLQQKGKKILDWKIFINGYRGMANKKFKMREASLNEVF